MPDYDRSKLAQWARELGFVRDTLEKVLRLSDVLRYINADPLLSKALALKGGAKVPPNVKTRIYSSSGSVNGQGKCYLSFAAVVTG